MSQRLVPFGRRILVKPEKASTLIQTNDTNLIERARVVSHGQGCEYKWEEGEIVVFTAYGVDSVDINGERHYFLLEDDAFLLGFYEDDTE